MSTEEEKRRKKREEEKRRQELLQRKKYRSLHDKHRERRKKDCMIGMPFIIAFQGDPAGKFYCNDYPDTFELIPRTKQYPKYTNPFQRLKTYLKHHVTSIHRKVLIYKAGEKD